MLTDAIFEGTPGVDFPNPDILVPMDGPQQVLNKHILLRTPFHLIRDRFRLFGKPDMECSYHQCEHTHETKIMTEGVDRGEHT